MGIHVFQPKPARDETRAGVAHRRGTACFGPPHREAATSHRDWRVGHLDRSSDTPLHRVLHVLAPHRGEWHALNLDTDAEDARELDLANEADWQWLADQLRTFGGKNE